MRPFRVRTARRTWSASYEVLGALAVRSWDLADPVQVNRLGTLARFSSLLADDESVRRRARPDVNVADLGARLTSLSRR